MLQIIFSFYENIVALLDFRFAREERNEYNLPYFIFSDNDHITSLTEKMSPISPNVQLFHDVCPERSEGQMWKSPARPTKMDIEGAPDAARSRPQGGVA